MAERKRKNETQETESVPMLKEIHNLRKARENLKTLDSRLNHIFNTLDNSFWGVDMVDFKMLYASPANEKIYGYTENEFLLKPSLWYQVIFPEDRHIGKQVMLEIAKGVPLTVEYRIIHKSGETRWIQVRLSPTLDDTGKLILVDGITLDITERKKADELLAQSEARLKENEQRLLAAQKVARMGDFTFNFSSNVWNCSAELDVITGLNATDILSFDKWVGLISDDVREEIINKIYPLIQEGTLPSGHYLDCKIKRAYDGEERWVSIVGEIELNESGKPLQLKGTVQDITERKKAEAEILKLNESLERKVEERTVELKQLNAELEAFSYTVSHDLQNPIRSLAGFSRILLNDYSKILDEDGREHLRNIEASAKRMSSLIRDLLNFAKLGKVTTAKANVDMNSIAQAAVAEIKPSAENLKTEIVLHELDCARCDAGLIRQVWNNLIGNAVKYSSKKDRPLVEIGMQQINGENAYYIRDNGAGFDMENSGKLFKAFERLHKHEFEGTGIGLSIVERIITKHGGSVWAESKPEQGAVFYFTLPSKGSAA